MDVSRWEIMMNPGKHGYRECDHCNGFGSSFKDPEGVDTCTKCKGLGLVKGENHVENGR